MRRARRVDRMMLRQCLELFVVREVAVRNLRKPQRPELVEALLGYRAELDDQERWNGARRNLDGEGVVRLDLVVLPDVSTGRCR